MKKLIFALVALFTVSMIYAQDFSIGVKAGIHYGATKTSDSDYNDHFSPIITPTFGFVFDYSFSDKFSLQPEILYVSSGFDRDETDNSGVFPITYDFSGRVNYISIPVMAKYSVMDNLTLDFGPYVSFLVGTNIDGSYTIHLPDAAGGDTTVTFGDDDQDSFNEKYNTTDFGLGVGATYTLDNGAFFSLRYNLGLSDINAEDLSEIPVADGVLDKDDTIKNNLIQFTVGYNFL